jgi:hypothetical protein
MELYMRFKSQVVQEIELLLSAARLSPNANSLLGHFFEPYAHEKIAAGELTGCVQLLTGDETRTTRGPTLAKIGSGSVELFDWSTTIRQGRVFRKGQYYRPKQHMPESINALARVGDRLLLFQISVSEQHPVKVEGLERMLALDLAKGCRSVHLVFVLPCILPGMAGKQPYISSQTGRALATVPTDISSIKQWCCRVVPSTRVSESPAE